MGHTVLFEIKRLLVHGVLHLLGFDHEKGDEGAGVMWEAEEKYLKDSEQ
jgi:probable rRNA maturation factor